MTAKSNFGMQATQYSIKYESTSRFTVFYLCLILVHLVHISQGYLALGQVYPERKVRGANMGPIWGRQDPGGPHVGPINFAFWVIIQLAVKIDGRIWINESHKFTEMGNIITTKQVAFNKSVCISYKLYIVHVGEWLPAFRGFNKYPRIWVTRDVCLLLEKPTWGLEIQNNHAANIWNVAAPLLRSRKSTPV